MHLRGLVGIAIAAAAGAALAAACGASHGQGSGGSGTSAGGHGASSAHGSGGAAASSGSTHASSSGSGGSAPKRDLHFYGRFDTSDPAGPRFAWPGSAIATRFSGTDLTLRVADQGSNFFAVVIDGGAPTVVATSGAMTDYVVAQGLAAGEHDVWIEKRTESFQGVVQFLGLVPSSGAPLVKTPEPFAHRIEFVGDSITCGYGNEGQGPDCNFSADTENEYLAWGAVAARAVNAAHASISYSGIGVYRDYGGSTTDQMPVKYERTFADDAASAWNFSWVPDVVVVDLGTNDFAQGDPGQAYVDAYVAFAKQIRGHYPDALILCAVGSMLTDPALSKARQYAHAVIAARSAAGDAHLDFVDLGVQDGAADGYGCDYHPSVATDQKMADKLVAKLHDTLGW